MKNNSARSYKALSGDSHRHKCFQNVALKAKFMVLCLRSSLAMQREKDYGSLTKDSSAVFPKRQMLTATNSCIRRFNGII